MYATIADADEYLTNRIGASGWFVLSDTAEPGEVSKESLLISAYRWLIRSPEVNLPAPQPGSNNEGLKQANIEAALYLLDFYAGMNERRARQAQGVESFRLGDREEKYVTDAKEIPDFILGFLLDYAAGGGYVFQLRGEDYSK